jgi:hypothetical protein
MLTTNVWGIGMDSDWEIQGALVHVLALHGGSLEMREYNIESLSSIV